MSGRLPGRFALVTGGAGGLGAASVLALLEEGCSVTATGISEAEIGALREDARYDSVNWLVLDVGDNAQVEKLAQATPQLDVLVNCAGIVLRQDAAFSEDGFAQVMDINVAGTMRCCRAFLPQLKKRPGTIVNIASMMSYFGSGTAPSYAASKGAVAQLTKSLAIAWAPHGIRVNAISPGYMRTDMTAPYIADPELGGQWLALTPMGRAGNPTELGGAVVYLASDAASFTTGHSLVVDGGYVVR